MQKLNVESELSQQAVNTIRLLCVDMVEKAKSGHPGMPCGAADYTFVLWTKFMKYNPAAPEWANRDRFVLSAGHGSSLLYTMLHLAGNREITMDELKNFRQWGSKTPGHPEVCLPCGIETTTGPLGQGIANATGMAIAAKMMASRFNKPGYEIINHKVWGIMGDGCLMEGISHEAASIAGHLGLGNLVMIYDDNQITIEGSTEITYSEDVELRFKSYGWNVLKCDGHNRKAIEEALTAASAETSKPTIIIAKTYIACCAPTKQGKRESHGEPLGAQEVAEMKKCLGWPVEEPFYVPDEVRALFTEAKTEQEATCSEWTAMFERYRAEFPEEAKLWDSIQTKEVPENITDLLLNAVDTSKDMASRESGGIALNAAAELIPSLVGGSADLAPSTKTWINGASAITKDDFSGRNFHFGVREHAMGAIMNGLSLYGGFIPFGSTFLVFADYLRPTIRLSAINHGQVIYVFTHDSIFVGEDGPTHQPIEQIASMRAMPNVTVIRPADTAETAVAWAAALKNTTGPTVLALSRQKLPAINAANPEAAKGLEKGAYIVSETPGEGIHVILIASGSEVGLAIEAQKMLLEKGIYARVVSMPSFELFEKQPEEYQEEVLPSEIEARVAIEAGTSFGWSQFTGYWGMVIGMDHFGASAPANVVAANFGFTPESVTEWVYEYLTAGGECDDDCGCGCGEDDSNNGNGHHGCDCGCEH